MTRARLFDRSVARISGVVCGAVCAFSTLPIASVAVAQQAPVNGMRPSIPGRLAIVGCKVLVAPGNAIERAAVLVRDGLIERVVALPKVDATDQPANAAAAFAVPDGYRLLDATGKTLLSAFIEPALVVDSAALAAAASARPGAHWNGFVTPEVAGADLALPEATLDALRAQGFAVARLLPEDGIFRGSSESRLLARASERVTARDLGGTFVQFVGPRSIDWSAMFGTQNPATPSTPAVPGVQQPGQQGARGERGSYPSSLMGSYALLRQTFMDAHWRNASLRTAAPSPLDDMNALDALQPLLLPEADPHAQSLLLDAPDELDFARLVRLARSEMPGTRLSVLASGNEFRAEEEIASLVSEGAMPVIVPLEFPQAPDLISPVAAETISLRDLMTWRYAPTNPKRLLARGASVALTTHRMQDKSAFRKRVADAMRHGLTADEALAALTTTPAAMLGITASVGTVEAGKLANFIVASGDPFVPETKFEGMFIAGTAVVAMPDAPVLAAGSFSATLQSATPGAPAPKPLAEQLRIAVDPKDATIKFSWRAAAKDDAPAEQPAEGQEAAQPKEDAATPGSGAAKSADETRTAAARRTSAADGRFAGLVDGAPLGLDGDTRIAIAGSGDIATMIAETADGSRFVFTLVRVVEAAPTSVATEKDGTEAGTTGEGQASQPGDPVSAPEGRQRREGGGARGGDAAEAGGRNAGGREPRREENSRQREDTSNLWKDQLPFPLGEFAVSSKPVPSKVLVRGATIWTQGPQGVLKNADMLVDGGRIVAIGADIAAAQPSLAEGAQVLDGRGMHVTPGLIDCHSHTGISGGVNEGTQSNTAEVWIGDVIDPTDIEWYRQLAGGLTAVNQLHGSANPIGGRNSVVKIRWGEGAEAFRFAGAPTGIKFALGENVVRSKSRYPSSRMGVATYIDDSFKAAVEYRARQKAHAALDEAARSRTVPPRKDLELETLAEIVEGTRLVHCHSYRQDEIVMLLRTAERYGFRIATLQHVLEGYKVAPEIAAHGAGASSFSDWWAYKIEVMDAIPWNGALLHRAGVLVSFNSDSDELARRMNMEAAKAVRYGGLSPEQALALVTINPAKQLRIDGRTGSLEVGKDADFAIWNGDPLSAFSRCEETWVDGVRRYRRADEIAEQAAIRSNRASLIAKAIAPAEGETQGASRGEGEGRGMRGGRGRGGRPPSLMERMLEAREDAIWLRIARGQDPFPTQQGDCGCGAAAAPVVPSTSIPVHEALLESVESAASEALN